jgi:hypothetical protein
MIDELLEPLAKNGILAILLAVAITAIIAMAKIIILLYERIAKIYQEELKSNQKIFEQINKALKAIMKGKKK